jgi:hypothetical protein
MDAAGLELMGETPGPGLMPGRWGLAGLLGSVGLTGLGRVGLLGGWFGLVGLTGLGRVGLLGGCAGLLPGIFGLLGWLWAERNEKATVQAATTPKPIAAVRTFFIFAPIFWFLKSCCI